MRRISELYQSAGIVVPDDGKGLPVKLGKKNRVNIIALGDVGTTMLIGLRLLGSDVIESIGLADINQKNLKRLEIEINQVRYPFGEPALPPVRVISESEVFDADLVLFCAARGVPPVKPGEQPPADVRMAQLDANADIVHSYARLARQAGYQGLWCDISDPVDPLAAEFLMASGLKPWQVKGFGLGVMNARAAYYAGQDGLAPEYAAEGRAYGPHGKGLVIANSLISYDDGLSRHLSDLALGANLKVRELGYKPYIAPSLSSAALSILTLLRGGWHYSSVWFGGRTAEGVERGAFLGIKNRMTPSGVEVEDLPLDDALYDRIFEAYKSLYDLRERRVQQELGRGAASC